MKSALAAAIPTLFWEHDLWSRGLTAVAGVDEVGCGPLAGPLVAAAVILPAGAAFGWLEEVRDSKVMTPRRRALLDVAIRRDAGAVGVGVVGPIQLDRLGLTATRRLAMARAIGKLTLRPNHLLVDAITLPVAVAPQTALIHGDALCISIACASIVAKVARDRYMTALDRRYPQYRLAENKGYGVPAHLEALRCGGPSEIHRHSFRPVKEAVCRCRRCKS